MRIILSVIVIFLCSSCSESKTEIIRQLISPDQSDVIRGLEQIGPEDRELMPYFLYHLNDARISHHYRYYGMSVYRVKVGRLRTLTGQEPPVPLTNVPDSTIIGFYLDLNRKAGGQSVLDSLEALSLQVRT